MTELPAILAGYHDRTGQLADTCAATVAAAVTAWQAGQSTDADLAAAVTAAIGAAAATATTLADLALAHYLADAPLGLTPPAGQADRLRAAVRTIVGGPEDVTARSISVRFDRLARAETSQAGQAAMSRAIQRRPHQITGWTRGLGGNPCVVCTGLASSITGVMPPAVPMRPGHATCRCVQVPAITER